MRDDDLLTIEAVATEKGIPIATLRHWRAHGRGPIWFKLGRKLYTTRADVNRWIADQRAQASVTR